MMYRLYIDENPRYADTSSRVQRATFATYEEALAAARTIVDDYLRDNHEPGMSPDDLFESFLTSGECPFIMPDDEREPFVGQDYARARCGQICAK